MRPHPRNLCGKILFEISNVKILSELLKPPGGWKLNNRNKGLFCLYQCFAANKFLRRRQMRNSLKIITPVIKLYYNHKSFDGKFSVDFDFFVKILIPPTHFEISAILVNCVGGFENFFMHSHRHKIVFRKIYISGRFDYLVALKSQKTWNSCFAPQRHHVVKSRKERLLNCVIFYKHYNDIKIS